MLVSSEQTRQTGHSVRVRVGLSSDRVKFVSLKFCLGSGSVRVKFGLIELGFGSVSVWVEFGFGLTSGEPSSGRVRFRIS